MRTSTLGLPVGKNSTIEWCDYTFNPWIGCQKVSWLRPLPCRTHEQVHKWNGGEWGPHAPRKRTSYHYWLQPLRRAKQAGDRRPRAFTSKVRRELSMRLRRLEVE